MAFKARYRSVPYEGINFRRHMLQGQIWPLQGKHEMYHVEMVEKGLTCDCPGFTYHGKCRHITRVGEALLGRSSIHAQCS